MKTIEERAFKANPHRGTSPYDEYENGLCIGWNSGYIQGATEQKELDDAEISRLKKAWEKEAEINHDAAMAYKQGRHDTIDKACEWIANYLMEIGYPDDWCRDSGVTLNGEQRFRKAMEE